MSTATASDTSFLPDSGAGARGRGEPRRIEGLGRAGLAIVAVASLVLSLNQTSQSMVARPFAEWLGNLFEALAVNAVIVATMRRHPVTRISIASTYSR